jgi:hypothetical protein
MTSTLVILKLMYDCARHSDSGSEPEFVNVLKNPGIDSTESTPPAYVAWRAGTITLFLLGS